MVDILTMGDIVETAMIFGQLNPPIKAVNCDTHDTISVIS
jgi:hypothetical protein